MVETDSQLFRAIAERNVKSLRNAIVSNANLSSRDSEGRTPLLYALACGQKESFKMLLDAGSDISAVDHKGMGVLDMLNSPADAAAILAHMPQEWVERVCVMALAGDTDGLVSLVSQSAESDDLEDPQANEASQASEGASPAPSDDAQAGRSAVSQLLDTRWRSRTALMWASLYGHAETAAAVAARCTPAQLNATDKEGWTALMLAASGGRADCVDVLTAAGANLEVRKKGDAKTAFLAAVASSHPECASRLAAAGAATDARDFKGRTALHLLADADATAGADILVAVGAPLLVVDDGSLPVLRRSAPRTSAAIARATGAFPLLCFAGLWVEASVQLPVGSGGAAKQLSVDTAVPSILDEPWGGFSPLMWAVRGARPGVARALLARGADPVAVDALGRQAIHHAAVAGASECVRVLVEAGADPAAVDGTGATALHLAAASVSGNVRDVLVSEASSEDIVRVISALIRAGACVDAQDKAGRTPLHLAAEAGASDVIAVILAAGASPRMLDNLGRLPVQMAANPEISGLFRHNTGCIVI